MKKKEKINQITDLILSTYTRILIDYKVRNIFNMKRYLTDAEKEKIKTLIAELLTTYSESTLDDLLNMIISESKMQSKLKMLGTTIELRISLSKYKFITTLDDCKTTSTSPVTLNFSSINNGNIEIGYLITTATTIFGCNRKDAVLDITGLNLDMQPEQTLIYIIKAIGLDTTNNSSIDNLNYSKHEHQPIIYSIETLNELATITTDTANNYMCMIKNKTTSTLYTDVVCDLLQHLNSQATLILAKALYNKTTVSYDIQSLVYAMHELNDVIINPDGLDVDSRDIEEVINWEVLNEQLGKISTTINFDNNQELDKSVHDTAVYLDKKIHDIYLNAVKPEPWKERYNYESESDSLEKFKD